MTHLKRCASDYVTEEGKFARFAEKCLYKTQGTWKRQWPPSREEITCTINRRPIYARFHFMDGKYHAVEFHPSATARDVMTIIKQKVGLGENAMGITSYIIYNEKKKNIRNKLTIHLICLGYAIYEVLNNTDRALLPDEKIAEVMSKWEKFRNSNATGQNGGGGGGGGTLSRKHAHHFFLFKKHLFLDQYINLDDPVEKELLYHQVLHDLRADRFPITEKEAVSIHPSWFSKLKKNMRCKNFYLFYFLILSDDAVSPTSSIGARRLRGSSDSARIPIHSRSLFAITFGTESLSRRCPSASSIFARHESSRFKKSILKSYTILAVAQGHDIRRHAILYFNLATRTLVGYRSKWIAFTRASFKKCTLYF